MGGAAGIVMLLGIIRSKFAALFIGTTGVGLVASFTLIQTFVSTLSGLGLAASAVRNISKAYSENNHEEIGRSVFALHRLSIISGILGLCLLAACSPMVSNFTFGEHKYTGDIAALGVIVFFVNLSSAYLAVLQGMRCVSEIARANIYSTLAGTTAALVFYISLGLRGIVPGLILASITQLAFAYHYFKKLNIAPIKQSWREMFLQSKSTISIGFSFVWGGLLISGIGYLTIYLINHYESIHSVGLYSAAFAISGAFVNFVLGAMSTDYYPRLAGMANDKVAMKHLINQQTEIGILLVVPGLMIGVIFAPWIIVGLYSADFAPGATLLQWFIAGSLGRVISWPMGYILLALGKARWFMIYETSMNALNAILITHGLIVFGLKGVSIAFFVLNMLSVLVLYVIAKNTIEFRWTASSKKLVFASISSIVVGFVLSQIATPIVVICIGSVFVLITTIFSLKLLANKIEFGGYLIRKISKASLINQKTGA